MENNNKKTLNYMDSNGKFYILGEMDDSISENIVPNLVKRIEEEVEKEESNRKIVFYINSSGGYTCNLYSILSLIDIAKKKNIKIYTIVLGRADSAASVLAIHGDYRTIYKYGTHLIHLGSFSTELKTFEQLHRTSKEIEEYFENIVKMYVNNTNMSEKQVKEILKDDLYCLNSSECKKFGFVDEII